MDSLPGRHQQGSERVTGQTSPTGARTSHAPAALLLAGAIVTEVTASLTLKAALHRPVLYAVVVVGYVAAFVFLALVLRHGMALGVAYGIWGALGVAGTAVLSAVIYHEALTGLMVLGIALAIMGVVVVEIGASRAEATGPHAEVR